MKNQRVVIKIGTSTLTGGQERLSTPRILDLVRQLVSLREEGWEVCLVTSGAIAVGREILRHSSARSQAVQAKQMLAAIGQPHLMNLYSQMFGYYGVLVAQVLLTRSDYEHRGRYLNARNTLQSLLEQGVLPIVNENDTVATEEIRVGDNDNLSAMVTGLVDASLLVILTDQAGLFTADPRNNPDAQLVEQVTGDRIPRELWSAAGNSSGRLGTGGMASKLQAADFARRCGAEVVIGPGNDKDVVLRIARGERLGTRIDALSSVLEHRRRHLLGSRRSPKGKIIVDHGAYEALLRGGSLLAVGIQRVEGAFERGDIVEIVRQDYELTGRGLTNYRGADLERIRGQHSAAIEKVLGYTYGEEVIHRNDMVVLGGVEGKVNHD